MAAKTRDRSYCRAPAMQPSKLPGFDCRYAARALPAAIGADRFAPTSLPESAHAGLFVMLAVMSPRMVRRAKTRCLHASRAVDTCVERGRLCEQESDVASLNPADATALRQNAAVLLHQARLTPITNPSPREINCVNLHFHWDLPKSNICWAK